MPAGPGIYDAECTALREATDATVAIAVVVDGAKGSGFSIQASYKVHPLFIADALQAVVNEIRKTART